MPKVMFLKKMRIYNSLVQNRMLYSNKIGYFKDFLQATTSAIS